MLELIISWAVPFVCGGVITGCVTYIRALKKRNTALENGVQCLLRAEIIRNYKEYSAKGYCPIYAKEALSTMYTAYHALKGNDIATDMYNTVIELPTEPKNGKE